MLPFNFTIYLRNHFVLSILTLISQKSRYVLSSPLPIPIINFNLKQLIIHEYFQIPVCDFFILI